MQWLEDMSIAALGRREHLSKWHAVIDLPRGGDGKRRQVTRSFDTAGQAHAWLAADGDRREQQQKVPRVRSMSDFLIEWLDGQVYLRPSTKATYRLHLDRHLIPAFGDLTLSQITVPRVSKGSPTISRRGVWRPARSSASWRRCGRRCPTPSGWG